MTTSIFEVLVENNNPKGQKYYSAVRGWISSWNDPNEYKMVHIERRTQKQAEKEGRKYGRVRSVRKLNIDRITGNSESIKIDNIPNQVQLINPFQSALDADEMVWKKVQKRRNNMVKEKQKIYLE